MEKEITFVTGNWAKIASAKQALEPLGFIIKDIKIETPEIQANDVTDVAMYSAKWASEKLKCSVLKNDSGLFIEGLKGFPGVYTHYADETIGVDGVLKMMDGMKNRNAYFKESLAYCEYGKEPVVFEGITKGIIDVKKSGKYGWSWDYVFIPDGQTKSFACFPDEERWNLWNSVHAYQELAKYLENK